MSERERESERATFSFNLTEPEWVARASFLKSEALHPADFTIREDGVVRLNPELVRRVAAIELAA